MFFGDSFMDADIRETLKENVKKTHYDKPTPIQKWAIPVILSGRDLMGCAQTGSGKTVSWHIVKFCRKIHNLIGRGHGWFLWSIFQMQYIDTLGQWCLRQIFNI